jgi:hypothetical protein
VIRVYDEAGNVIETTRRLLLTPLRGNQLAFRGRECQNDRALLWRFVLNLSVFYSVRNAVIGFTCMARRAGRKQASSVARASSKLEVISANGSLGLT